MTRLSTISLVSLTLSCVGAWSPSTRLSSFSGAALRSTATTTRRRLPHNNAGMTMYDHRGDPPSDKNNNNSSNQGGGGGPVNAWSVLATTEEWISNTLQQASAANGGQNPYTRKEVSYVCETACEQPMILANIFRRLKEARLQGQRHGEQENERAEERGSSYRPNTLRQTQVVVLPSNQALCDSFPDFHKLVETVNAVRRTARDFVTGSHLERMDGDDEDDEESPWSVSVNCAHLHPNYGRKTPEQELEELKAEEEAGEVDLNYQKFKAQRMMARRSPYPTVVLEVCARPPPDFGATPPPEAAAAGSAANEDQVTAADISKLEALFGQSAHMQHPTKHTTAADEEEDFYARIGDTIQELSPVTPLQLAQDYIATHDPHVPSTAAFTTTDATEPDEAFEFVLTNLSMMAEQAADDGGNDDASSPRFYVVLPHFCDASATSLEKFGSCLAALCEASAELRDHVEFTTYHPEHILPTRRAPVPVVSMQWKD